MNGLIRVDYSGEKPAVSARELHEFLGVDTEYRHWFPRMCEYGFTQGEDFNPFKNDRVQLEGTRTVTRTVEDAAITIDMAKEICMLQLFLKIVLDFLSSIIYNDFTELKK